MNKHEIIHGNCLDHLTKCDMIFADPFDNIGLDYDGFVDVMPDIEYFSWFEHCLFAFCRHAPVVWVSFNSQWILDFAPKFKTAALIYGYEFKPCVQTFTFYQQNKCGLGNAHRPLWRLKHPDAPENAQAIKIPSWRQLNGDKRAAQGGKVPGDSHDQLIEVDDSFFDFSRVVGNSPQRRKWHKTQLNEELVERCIKLNTNEGAFVIDPFGGTGTTLRVCKQIGRRCRLIEKSDVYYEKLREEHPDVWFPV